MHTENQYALESLCAGVKGYVAKTNTGAELVHALDAVCKGQIYLTPRISPAVLEAYRSRDHSAGRLASRERQVLCQIAEGKSTRQIAELLGISHKTVQCHRANIMDKLGLQDTASLVRYALSSGLIES
jgi:DNA-binding NarL/FixJ family response regulator